MQNTKPAAQLKRKLFDPTKQALSSSSIAASQMSGKQALDHVISAFKVPKLKTAAN